MSPTRKLARSGTASLSSEELLALLLDKKQSLTERLALASSLLSHFGGLKSLLGARFQTLTAQPGLKPACAARLLAISELARRNQAEHLLRGTPLESPDATCNYLQSALWDQRHELFLGVFLDTRHRVIACEELFRGTIDGATVYPRVVAEKALQHDAAALIVAHNHPSGIAEPSLADQAITRRLKDALALLDIRLLDHFVIGDGDPVSMASRGML